MMFRKKLVILVTGLLILLPILGSTRVSASSVASSNNIGQVNTHETFGAQRPLDNMTYTTRERGWDSYGRRPKIYPANLTAKQKDCLINIAGSSILSSFAKPWFLLPGSVALAWYNHCSKL
ncbi:hypothetical protein [Lactococcus ileimucosae]|uniref:hypothetical protein n=1 Tax=Lactococcus ileimucosae TaxID=2941329 RepID=UPI002042D58A|nr:hypothetical protein [Lactococcus ileimucosae]